MTRLPAPPCRALSAAAILLGALAAQAQTAGAGMDLQQPVPPQPLPADPSAMPAVPAEPAREPALPGGASVTLQAVVIEGNTLIDTPTLLAALGPVQGRRFDFSGLQGLARAVTATYRAQGYPFTQAVLPAQNLAAGTLRLQVIEGVYGRILPVGDDPLVPQAQAFLDAELHTGAPISNRALERAMLLLNDQPGFRVQPTLRPGAERGEGDLLVGVERRNHWSGEAALDNAGSRATGEYRARAALAINSPWRLGDRVSLNALTTDKRMWLGSAEYETPLGGSGVRGAVSAARNSYQLDGAFSALQAQGRADVATAKLSYAVLRTQRTNLGVSVSLQHKRLHDDLGAGLLVRDKSSELAILAAQFDHRDAIAGGGVTYGSASTSIGHLRLDADSAAADAASAQTAGGFRKWNLDVARIQKLPGTFSAYLRLSGQWSDKNLDASEKLGLGGFLGVRAYPMGEATGDRGWLGQFELRHDAGVATVFAFVDGGRVKSNARPWSADSEARRSLRGAGLGLRWLRENWSVEATLATRTTGTPPASDPDDRRPRTFVAVSRRFD